MDWDDGWLGPCNQPPYPSHFEVCGFVRQLIGKLRIRTGQTRHVLIPASKGKKANPPSRGRSLTSETLMVRPRGVRVESRRFLEFRAHMLVPPEH